MGMNKPLLAAIITVAAPIFLGWWIWIMTKERSSLASYASFLSWSVPLFYAGGWAAGYNIGETTLGLALVAFCYALGAFRQYLIFELPYKIAEIRDKNRKP
jgi:hypothetical protein